MPFAPLTPKGEADFESWLIQCGVVDLLGKFNEAQARLELSDYFQFLTQASLVYDHVSGGRISKPNTMAFEVTDAADEYYAGVYREQREELEEMLEAVTDSDGQPLNGLGVE
jgi:hypothetical protein